MTELRGDCKVWHLTRGEVLITGHLAGNGYRVVTPWGAAFDTPASDVVHWDQRPISIPDVRPATPTCTAEAQTQIMLDVQSERTRQDKLYGPQNRCATMDRMFVALGEEFGEACQAHLSDGNTGKSTDKCDLRKELIQVAALAVAMCERIDADQDPVVD